MNPYHAIIGHDREGYEPIIRDVGRSLYGIIVVKKDSPFNAIEDLDGKKVAFPAPNALGAALIPRAEFSRKYNIDVEEMYVGSHSSVYLNVALGLAAAGGGVQKTLSQQPEQITSQLRIISKTQEVPPHPITAHKRVPDEVKQAVSDAFLKIAATEQGAKLLKKIPMVSAGKASIQDYQLLNEMKLDEFYVK
jgi:phosphonate transport system substrate-binding protein